MTLVTAVVKSKTTVSASTNSVQVGGDVRVVNSNGSFDNTYEPDDSPVTLPNITKTDSDGTTSSIPSNEDVICTLSSSIDIGMFSNAGHTTPVIAGEFYETVYLLATPTGFTATKYRFEYQDANGVLALLYEGVNNNYAWTINGAVGEGRMFAEATDDDINWETQEAEFEIEPVFYLDLTSVAAVFAVSVARYLKSSFFGQDVVLVRRSSDNSQLGFNVEEITDGTLLTFVGSGDGFVVRLYDHSGNGNDRVISTAGQQFYLVVSGVLQVDSNGKPKTVTQSTGASAPFGNTAFSLDSTSGSFSMVSQKFRGASYGTRWAVLRKGSNTNLATIGYSLQGYDSGGGAASSQVGSPNLFANGVDQGSSYTGGDVYSILGNTEVVSELLNIDFSQSSGWLTNFSEFVAVNDGEISEWVLWNGDVSADRANLNANSEEFYGY